MPELPWQMAEEGLRPREVGMMEWMDRLCEARKTIRRLSWLGGPRGHMFFRAKLAVAACECPSSQQERPVLSPSVELFLEENIGEPVAGLLYRDPAIPEEPALYTPRITSLLSMNLPFLHIEPQLALTESLQDAKSSDIIFLTT